MAALIFMPPTLGIRSNNPLNLRPGGWQGETGVNEKGFAIFSDMPKGIRAAIQNFKAYQDKHGIDTIGPVDQYGNAAPVSEVGKPGISPGVVCRWSTTDREAYITYVCTVTNLNWADKIDLHDSNTQYWLIAAMGEMENGHDAFAQYVSDADIEQGIQEAA